VLYFIKKKFFKKSKGKLAGRLGRKASNPPQNLGGWSGCRKLKSRKPDFSVGLKARVSVNSKNPFIFEWVFLCVHCPLNPDAEGSMDKKTLSLILVVLIAFFPFFAWTNVSVAGQNVITGTIYVTIPPSLGIKTSEEKTDQKNEAQPPQVTEYPGAYELQKTEKLIESEDSLVETDATGTPKHVIIYTVCAK
jgi:hypothetical protein